MKSRRIIPRILSRGFVKAKVDAKAMRDKGYAIMKDSLPAGFFENLPVEIKNFDDVIKFNNALNDWEVSENRPKAEDTRSEEEKERYDFLKKKHDEYEAKEDAIMKQEAEKLMQIQKNALDALPGYLYRRIIRENKRLLNDEANVLPEDHQYFNPLPPRPPFKEYPVPGTGGKTLRDLDPEYPLESKKTSFAERKRIFLEERANLT